MPIPGVELGLGGIIAEAEGVVAHKAKGWEGQSWWEEAVDLRP